MNNGHNQDDTSRLDRIEGIIEAIANRQAGIEDEFLRLLKAQIVFGDEVGKAFKAADARMTKIEAALEKLTVAGAEAEGKINALISLMDQHLRDHREGIA